MDELTMLVQVAGGEPEAVERLRAAGLRRVKDIAAADAEEVGEQGGLPGAVAKRLVKAAREHMEPAEERPSRAPRNGLAAVSPVVQAWGTDARASTAAADRTDAGVSRAESAALVGEAPREEPDSLSFWRFG